MRYAAIHTLRERYPLSVLISVLEVSSSGYHSGATAALRLANRPMIGWSARSGCCMRRASAVTAVRASTRL